MPDFLTDPLPDPDEDGLLDLPLFDEMDDPPPATPRTPPATPAVPRPKPVRAATVKERVMLPPNLTAEAPRRKPAPAAAKTPPAGETSEFKGVPEPPPYRPRQRPPVALLVVLDDGREDGEVHRLRGEVTVIGRTQGDVQVPHDELISSRHAEVRRVREGGAWRWVLADLGSTNGTFVKIATLQMKAGQEIQVGHSRLRFDLPAADAADPPALVEVTPGGEGRRFPLAAPDNWIGADPAGAVALGGDPLIARRHAHLYCAGGVWHLGEGSGRDGVWLRRDRVTIDKSCSFQCGEQRFLFKVP